MSIEYIRKDAYDAVKLWLLVKADGVEIARLNEAFLDY